jgi:uncharacterized protein (UPF0548 family)
MAVIMSLREPAADAVQAFLNRQSGAPFSYDEVGASRTGAPAGFTVDHNQTPLGAGRAIFDRACASIRAWRMFDLGWVRIHPVGASIAPGSDVVVLAHFGGVWFQNACRTVYLVEEPRRYGFAYGTLADHAETGEERFTVEWRSDDSVWYDLFAFSKPRHPLARLGKPFSRALQRRFARESLAAMRAAAGASG